MLKTNIFTIIDNLSLQGEAGVVGGVGPVSAAATEQSEDRGGQAVEGGEHSVFATDYCSTPDPLRQLLTALCRTAMDQAPDDPLYLAFARIMAKVSCICL